MEETIMTLKGCKRRIAFFFINELFYGVKPNCWTIKRNLLNWAGFNIGEGTKVVGPLTVYGDLEIGKNTWIGTGFKIHGNGIVKSGSNCDIAPDVTFLTGSHELGDAGRRAGAGRKFRIIVNDGTWIGARSTLVGDIEIGKGCVIGACALVNKSFLDNVLIVGVPAQETKIFE
jgi:acetyltransferase-like isoleucine patch superfamily enzyme